jgi:hypothetical protein
MGLSILATIASAGASQAAVGTVDLSWDGCTPVIADRTSTPPTADNKYTVFASETGNDQQTSGYQINFIYGSATAGVPDAWDFSPDGCQGSPLATLAWLPPAALSKSCPAFQQTAASLQITSVNESPPADPYAVSLMRVVLANAYPTGVTANPALRYFLMSAAFDHTFSVVGPGSAGATCGFFETAMCFKLSKAAYIELSTGFEVPFNRGNSVLTFNGTTACGGVPAKPTTWGKIKGQYRN